MPFLEVQLITEETFTFSPNNGEPEIHIFSGRLRAWLLKHAMHKVGTLIFPQQTPQEMIALHGLEADRMASMTEAEAREPVIVGLTEEGTNILIDGAHRRWFWAERGRYELDGWLVPAGVWTAYTFNPADLPGIHGQDGSLLPQRRR